MTDRMAKRPEDMQPEKRLGKIYLQGPEPKSPAWVIDRTARYAKDPTAYLKETLGEKEFTERQSFMCITDINRDHYGSGSHKQHFEKHIASLLGKTQGLFFITGVQAQLIALKIYCARSNNNRVAWHVTSHLEEAEQQAWEHLYALDRTLLGHDPEENPTLSEIMEVLSLPETHRPAAIVLELPNRSLGCKTYAFQELCEISEACRNAGCKLHLDGARLWEIEPYYQAAAGKTFQDVCQLFDSVYVSFYKGLGGIGGAVLAFNDETMVAEAKKWQRRAGGNLYTSMCHVIDDERGFNENIGTFARRRNKMIDVVEAVNKATAKYKTKKGLPYVSCLTATCSQVHTLLQGFSSDRWREARDKVFQESNVRVFEWLSPKKTNGEVADPPTMMLEWSIIGATENIETEIFVQGFVALCEELQQTKS